MGAILFLIYHISGAWFAQSREGEFVSGPFSDNCTIQKAMHLALKQPIEVEALPQRALGFASASGSLIVIKIAVGLMPLSRSQQPLWPWERFDVIMGKNEQEDLCVIKDKNSAYPEMDFENAPVSENGSVLVKSQLS